MASSLSYDDDLAQGYDDDDDAAYRHTQFLDLTNGEGGSREAYYMGDSDDDGGGGGGGGPDTGAETVAAIDTSTPGKVVETGQEHTGRWTREEHAAFLSALKTYGKEWKKVAAKVKTRTVVQTRTHAQKYFQKLHKAMNQNDKSVTSVEMGVAAEAKKVSAQKKKKAKPQRSQSTASTHAAAHVMTHLSSAQMPTTSASFPLPMPHLPTLPAHTLLHHMQRTASRLLPTMINPSVHHRPCHCFLHRAAFSLATRPGTIPCRLWHPNQTWLFAWGNSQSHLQRRVGSESWRRLLRHKCWRAWRRARRTET